MLEALDGWFDAVEAEGLEEASLIGSTEGLMAAIVESLNHKNV